jgi:hypothetical protein
MLFPGVRVTWNSFFLQSVIKSIVPFKKLCAWISKFWHESAFRDLLSLSGARWTILLERRRIIFIISSAFADMLTKICVYPPSLVLAACGCGSSGARAIPANQGALCRRRRQIADRERKVIISRNARPPARRAIRDVNNGTD